MKIIPLINGYEAIVDDEDFHYLSRFHWGIMQGNGTITAIREFTINKKLVVLPMWKFIVPSESNKEILYLNRNTLDLRKENLSLVPNYIASHYAAKRGRGKDGMPTSKYKGVSYSANYQGRKKWIGDIVLNEKRYSKHFLTEIEAAEFYNEKAREIYGEHAYQNKL